MADARALLRQQRAARRIQHPYASYTDSGKLICTVCHEHVKTESLWDGHLRSAGHRQRLQALQQTPAKNGAPSHAGFLSQNSNGASQPHSSSKRKLGDSDEDMTDGGDEETRRKRAKGNVSSTGQSLQEAAGTPAKLDDESKAAKPITPPLTRRTSGTPTIGVELQIPSRPATPSAGGTPMFITPKAAPIGRSPLIPEESLASDQQAPGPSAILDTHAAPADSAVTTDSAAAVTTTTTAAAIDEDEWAAFEAELVHGTTRATTTSIPPGGKHPALRAAAAASLDSDVVISAPVMSAAEVAAKSEEEERARRRALVDLQIEDEREEATRALETEFEVMEELEARARRLRERREALRLQRSAGGAGADAGAGEGTSTSTSGAGGGNSTAPVVGQAAAGAASGSASAGKAKDVAQADDDDEEDVDEEDDWDGFRFRA